MSRLGHMRAFALVAALNVTGCSRDCASRSATAEVEKGISALEGATEPRHEGMPETIKYVAANENRLNLGKAWIEIERIGGPYTEPGEKR